MSPYLCRRRLLRVLRGPAVIFLFYILMNAVPQANTFDQEEGALVAVEGGSDKNDGAVNVETREESFIDPDVEQFIPTHEWQKVKKGQAIPAGLHIKFNMKTGENEAKLMEEDGQNDRKPPRIKIAGSADAGRAGVMQKAIEDAMKELGDDQVKK